MSDRLARALAGLPPDQEHQFQTFMAFDPSVRAWRNSFENRFGEQPNTTSDSSYDYRAAWAAGNRPQPVPNDTVWHWGSVGKAADHPTEWKQQFMTQFGSDPDQVEQWTPDMQQFMQQQIGRQTMPLGLPPLIKGF
jgi:hypothetical protein